MPKTLKSFFLRLHNDQRGAMSVEKVLILAVIALPILVVLYLFRQAATDKFTEWAAKLGF